jgi:hypothetical protein
MQPQVFIVWAHSSPGWDDARVQTWKHTVHAFAQLLHRLGVDPDLDLFNQHLPVDWSTYCLQRMEDVDRIVVAVSTGWRLAFRGDSPMSAGAEYELKHLRGMLMRKPEEFKRKVVVAVLPGASVDDIPFALNCVPHFRVDPSVPSTAVELEHVLHGRPMYRRPRAEPRVRELARAGDPGVAAELLGTTVFLPDPGEPGLVTTSVDGYEKAVLVFTGLDRLVAYRRAKELPWEDRWLEVEGAELLPFVASARLAVVVDAGAAEEETVFLSSSDVGALIR